MGEFMMPSLGADMEAGTLQEWLVAPGDVVKRGDVVAVVETDKSAIEVECFETGTVGRLLVEPGTRVAVGTPLAVIDSATAQGPVVPAPEPPVPRAEPSPTKPLPAATTRHTPVPRRSPANPPEVAARQPMRAKPAVAHTDAGPLVRHLAAERGIDLASVNGTGRGGRITRADVEHAGQAGAPRVRATPYARRLALEMNVDLAQLHGTGENGAVRAADIREAVRAHAVAERSSTGVHDPGATLGRAGAGREAGAASTSGSAAPAAPAAQAAASDSDRKAATMRRAIADLMARSKREIPHYYLAATIDMATALAWLRGINRARLPGERLLPAALLLKAAAVAACEVPALNGFWQDGFVAGDGVHLGVAVSLRDGGLLTPVIHDADSLTCEELMGRLKDLAQRARRGRLRGSEVSGATLTVTSLGEQGVESVFGVIYPPQVALVGFGAVVERPWAVDGLLGVRPVVTATLSGDHRASDGATGARYLTTVARLLQKPEELS
ncbi:dihydrolipoamide acetyltransferase family protein [Streptomyces sp. HUAS TT7]|uniref:dihydrolipoamide acetyltransferase family protein n=1 Tax=Streptomyces sp. HUAS TT7 TaxID=3447507 RepID=UPI003F65BFD4